MKYNIFAVLISSMLLITSGMFARAQESHVVQALNPTQTLNPTQGTKTQETASSSVSPSASSSVTTSPSTSATQASTTQEALSTQEAHPTTSPNTLQTLNPTHTPTTRPTQLTTHTKKYTIYFRVNESTLDPDYQGNAQTMETMIQELGAAVSAEGRVSCQIEISASASPEGRYHHNEKLSQRRMEVVLSALKKNIDVTDVTFHTNSLVEDWTIVADYVAEDQQVPCRQEVLQIINSFDGQQDIRAELQKIGGGAYDYILNNFFPLLRSAKVVAVYDLSERFAHPQLQSVSVTFTHNAVAPQPQLASPNQTPTQTPTQPPAPSPTQTLEPKPTPEHPTQYPFINLKTNLIGLGFAHANIAVEAAVAEHISVALPFYYSGGFDYLRETLKFRGIVLQPEVRYYIKGNEGFYAGAHLGIGWYNFALDGEYRIQDHRGRRPAIGGGIGIGYTLPFKKHPRWGMEFAVGAGVYDVKYDVFYNEPNGAYAEHGKRGVFFGVDNAAISFTYKFPLKKEGRR